MYNTYNEKAKEIKVALFKLEEGLLNHHKSSYILNSSSRGRYLWSIYDEYLREILELFKGDQESKCFSRLYEKVGIESLYIRGDSYYEESKCILESYIQQVKTNLLLED